MRGPSRSDIRKQILIFTHHMKDPTLHEVIEHLRSLGHWREDRLTSLAVYKDCQHLVRDKALVQQKVSKRVKKRLRKACKDKERDGQIMRHTRYSYRLPRRRKASAEDSVVRGGSQDGAKPSRRKSSDRRIVLPGEGSGVQRSGDTGSVEKHRAEQDQNDVSGNHEGSGSDRAGPKGRRRKVAAVATASKEAGGDEQ